MPTFLERWRNDEDGTLKKRTYKILANFIILMGLFVSFGILFPTAIAVVLNVIWITLFAGVITFLTLGVLVVMGMKKEVGEVLDIFLEGSLTVLDAIEFLKRLWEKFKALVREFLVFAAPIFAYVLAFIIYIILLTFYKNIGKTYDVTIITILLTIILVVFVGILNRPKKTSGIWKREWIINFITRFHRGFTDGLEVVLFMFFLTMDSSKLFFLPDNLNHELKAQIGTYNLMYRGINLSDATKITVSIIIATVSLEILRMIIKLIAMAKLHYSDLIEEEKLTTFVRLKHVRIKDSIKMAFYESKEGLTRFITYNTVLLIVFLFFPRLKLLTLVVASITGFILDLLIRGRLTIKQNTDLLSRLMAKAFGI
ncbi:hypothetical protein HYV31_01760 [candidate division WWE3 bacterium]|nr:hypothetical protein [candidate division WWE3 bacterium]